MNQILESNELLRAYGEADYLLRLRNARIAIILTLILMPSFGILDWIVYPSIFWSLIKIRILFDLAYCGLLIATYTFLGRYIKTIGVVGALFPGIVLSWMVMITDGAASPYYAGLNLIVLVMSVLLPWTVSETLIVCLFTIVIYIGACYGNIGFNIAQFDASYFFNNLFFLVSTSIICLVASHYQSKRRFDTFRLNFALDSKNRELAELDQLKSQFFANISHELRTPLTLILGPIQDLLRSPANLTDQVASLLATARDNGLRLLKLVNDLLDLIRFEEGKSKLELRPIELTLFLKGLIDSVRHLAQSRGINIEAEIKSETVFVFADQAALERVFLNLFSNAIKFTPNGGTIRVKHSSENDQAVINVTDTGIGIDPEEIPFIFDRFHQADSSTTRKYTGTGIGLSLVKQLIENMHGAIVVKSEAGVGTSMLVSIPLWHGDSFDVPEGQATHDTDLLEDLHQAAQRTLMVTMEEPENYYSGEQPGGLPIVLLVEDESAMRRYLTDMLADQYQVIQARDGLKGLQAAREIKPDLMVLDLMLPEIDGLEVCRLLKQDDSTRNIKIILLTARIDEEAKLTALGNGADDFLTKPFGKLELETRLANLHKTGMLEKDLKNKNKSLNSTIGELKKTQAQLLHSEKLNALGSLSAGLLHEINNPLNYTLTAIHLVKLEDLYNNDHEFAEMIDDIDQGMQRIQHIVSDLRAFAYPSEAEKQVPFPIRDAVQKALRFTASELQQIDIKQNMEDVEMVLGSQSHIVQVLVNLLTNAAKAIKRSDKDNAGEILIASEIYGDRLLIKVSDNGVGMDENIKHRVFEPFFTTAEIGEGVGMGLSICYTTVKNHGGDLKVESEPKKGTTFIFDLPLADK